VIAVLALLAVVWPAVDGLHRLRGLLAPLPPERRRARLAVVLVHGLAQLAPFALALIVAVALVTVPSGLIGSLGFFPLLRGLGALTSASFVSPPLAGRSLRGALDRIALFLPVLALATGAEMITLTLAFVGCNAIVAVWALLRPQAEVIGDDPRGDRIRPWLQLALGIAVLIGSGTFNWLLQPRD
jgi:cadmium resistance protein CadD (predicted permease)